MHTQQPKQEKLIDKKHEPFNKKALILKNFPLHNKDELMAYNIYIQETDDGIQKSKMMRYPCIRQGCMTTCYFDIKSNGLMNVQEINFCLNCGNENSRIYLDIGYKVFLQKHHKYIALNQPFNVQINPIKKEHKFPHQSLTNHISTQLSSFITYKLFEDLRLKQAPINNQIINFDRVRNDFSTLISPKQQKKNYFLYSFCKYYPQPSQEQNHLLIIVWLYREEQALKVRILRENNKQMCDVKEYLSFGMVNFMINLNTLIFAIPKNGVTQYFVSKVDHHFCKEQMVLKVVEMQAWKDPQSRLYASLVVDQNINSIFVIGGLDKTKNDSLDYISCFTKCRWETIDKLEFKAEIQKDHKLFAGQGSSRSKYLSSSRKTQRSENTFAFINNIFMIYYYNRKVVIDEKDKFLQGTKPLYKQFFSIGGAVKDPTNTSIRLKNEKPGIRSIIYDTTSKQNPIIYENDSKITFSGNSYFSFQIPYNPTISLRKFKSNIIVFGGHRAEASMVDFRNKKGDKQDPYKQDPNFENIYLVDMADIRNSQIINEKFKYSHLLPLNLDQFSILLQDEKNKYFVRATLPLEKPIGIKDGYIHYIVLQFWLDDTMFYFIPILSPIIENSEIQV